MQFKFLSRQLPEVAEKTMKVLHQDNRRFDRDSKLTRAEHNSEMLPHEQICSIIIVVRRSNRRNVTSAC
jgi:hypothetical protein